VLRILGCSGLESFSSYANRFLLPESHSKIPSFPRFMVYVREIGFYCIVCPNACKAIAG
jgi:hypothetical protein